MASRRPKRRGVPAKEDAKRRRRRGHPTKGTRRAHARRGRRRKAELPVRAAGAAAGQAIATLFIWAGIAFAAVIGLYALDLPDTSKLWQIEAGGSVRLVDAEGRLIASRGVSYGDHVSLSDLPAHVVWAVLAAEDRRFYDHFGLDIFGLARAAFANLETGKVVQGGSTITQQLAKNLFLSSERTFKRKVQEAMLALWLESRFTKNQILSLYLNRVYFGAGTYGIGAAAQRYFDKPAQELTLNESALLVGLLKAPSRYAPTSNPEGARERAEIVLTRMEEEGYIGDEERAGAAAAPAPFARTAASPGANYFVDWVLDSMADLVGQADRDLIVETTLDLGLQARAEEAVAETLAAGIASGIGEAGLVAMTPDGAVRAMVGGRSYNQSQFNRAAQARRQPGSAFKPFVYLAALEKGMEPSSTVMDAPLTIGSWTPKNFDERYRGEVTLTRALAESLNTAAVRLSERVTRRAVASVARRLGIASPLPLHASLALGTEEVTLLELTGAYVPFANGGRGVIPHGIIRIRTNEGEELYAREGSGPGRVIAPEDLEAIDAMLAEAMRSGTGRAARLEGRPAGGKTGTSQGFRDAWFVGFTADFVAGVWVGNDDGTPMDEVTGGRVPAAIWKSFMESASAGRPPRALPGGEPPAIVAALEDEKAGVFDRLSAHLRLRMGGE